MTKSFYVLNVFKINIPTGCLWQPVCILGLYIFSYIFSFFENRLENVLQKLYNIKDNYQGYEYGTEKKDKHNPARARDTAEHGQHRAHLRRYGRGSAYNQAYGLYDRRQEAQARGARLLGQA